MSSPSDVSSTQLAVLRARFPRAVISNPQPLRGGVSSGATCWDVEAPSGNLQRVVVRTPSFEDGAATRGRARVEAYVLEHLNRHSVRVPRLIAFAQEQGCLVLEFVEGAPCLTTPPPRSFAADLARELSALHQLPIPAGAASVLPDRSTSVTAHLAKTPHQPDESTRETFVRHLLQSHCPPRVNSSVLLHGDFWPGNVLWHRGELAAVIDWEEAELGDPLSDLAITRLDLLWAFGETLMDEFTDHYLGRVPCHPAALPWWDLVAALRPAQQLPRWASAYVSPPMGRPDITAELMRQRLLWFVDDAQRRLEGA